jgi:hypothetical protein
MALLLTVNKQVICNGTLINVISKVFVSIVVVSIHSSLYCPSVTYEENKVL